MWRDIADTYLRQIRTANTCCVWLAASCTGEACIDVGSWKARLTRAHATASGRLRIRQTRRARCLPRARLESVCKAGAGFLATRVLPGAIWHTILRTSVKPRYILLSISQDPELVLLSLYFCYPSGIDPWSFVISTLKNPSSFQL